MIELFSKDRIDARLQSSKGNQLKFQLNSFWYKADYLGYEGLAEFVISRLLALSDLEESEFVHYDLEQIRYRSNVYPGCRSLDFLDGWQLITLERLFQQHYGHGVNQIWLAEENHQCRLQLLVEYTERVTGLKDFGLYMSKMLTIDTFFLNEDRHAHNIAIMTNQHREYRLAPFFDHGAGLLSDTTMDYPLNEDPLHLIPLAKPKTFCNDFDEQIDIAESLYGQHLRFSFSYEDIKRVLDQAESYSPEIRSRVMDILLQRRRKYHYLFTSATSFTSSR